jgi:predicted ATPase
VISSLSVENVRLFSGERWDFPLPRLTVFCGTNSAGKSTLLKVPLALRQTQSAASGAARHGTLRLGGPQVDLGGFNALVAQHDLDLPLGLGLSIPHRMPTDTAKWLRQLWDGPPTAVERPRRTSELKTVEFSSWFCFRAEPEGKPHDHALARSVFSLTDGVKPLLRWTIEPEGDGFRLLLPRVYFEAEFRGYGAYQFEDPDSAKKDTASIGLRLRGLLPDTVLATVSMSAETDSFERALPLPRELAAPLQTLEHALRQIHYLGPLRTPASRFYVASGDVQTALDSAGEFLPHVLRDRAGEDLVAPLPSGELEEVSLAHAVGSWLTYLRTGDTRGTEEVEIKIEATRSVLVELDVRASTGAGMHPLADSGFGYSQVLPILVRGLLAGPDDTLVIEQPELHLHPALQVRLAYFFTALARADRQVILETHSEHLVNAIRVFAAEDASGEIARVTSILYIDASNQPPILHNMGLRRDGTVPEWPRQFFGEALELSARLLRAQRV